MTETAIRVRDLGKQYTLGAGPSPSLREQLARLASAPLARLRRSTRPVTPPPFWALRDVSFDVEPGEVVGIIGRNGAGKSTLLKILSRITEPTRGVIDLRGRVASLLEVGTGFHAELTGRENVFLNGAILGMTQREIRKKFDEIVAFAGVEQFIDTPVKRYSSGMYLRLAFAVAAHLESEILVVDEVLAVGDAAFQKRCIGKMEETSHQGRTILFVSHNLAAVTQLCPRAILLSQGRLVAEGPSFEVVTRYLTTAEFSPHVRSWSRPDDAPGGSDVRLLAARVTQDHRTTSVVDINRPTVVEVDLLLLHDARDLVASYKFFDVQGTPLFSSCDWRPNALREGVHRFAVEIPAQVLAEGRVNVCFQAFFFEPHTMCVYQDDLLAFDAIDSNHPDSVRGPYKGSWSGAVRLKLDWRSPEYLGADVRPTASELTAPGPRP